MSADLVDPFARPEPVRYQASAYDMCDQITVQVANSRWDDPELPPQLIQRTLQRLRQAVDDGTPEVSGFARWVLEDLWHRAESGVPYGEPQEPSWSLDSEQDLWPHREVLGPAIEDVMDDL